MGLGTLPEVWDWPSRKSRTGHEDLCEVRDGSLGLPGGLGQVGGPLIGL